jgi:hypothetical protein
MTPYIDKMDTRLCGLIGGFNLLEENDIQIPQERFEPQSIRKKHQLIECLMTINHFFINEGVLLFL